MNSGLNKKLFIFIALFVILIVVLVANRNAIEFALKYKLNSNDYKSVVIMVKKDKIVESNDKAFFNEIIKEINTSDRQDGATKMIFEEGPNGSIILQGDEEVRIAFFTDTGHSIYGDYFIYTNFNFDEWMK